MTPRYSLKLLVIMHVDIDHKEWIPSVLILNNSNEWYDVCSENGVSYLNRILYVKWVVWDNITKNVHKIFNIKLMIHTDNTPITFVHELNDHESYNKLITEYTNEKEKGSTI